MTKKLDKAIEFAIKAHSGQTRKAGGAPYVLHPLEAAVIAGTMTNDDEVLAAAVLHDVAEDAGISIDEIEKTFGKRVAELVTSETEDKRTHLPPEETWKIRKEESLKVLEETDDDGVRMIWLADKLSNMRSIFFGVHEKGDAFFDAFNQKDKKMHEWYYRRIAELLSPLKDTEAYREYVHLIDKVFN